jgi:hypothetical protein
MVGVIGQISFLYILKSDIYTMCINFEGISMESMAAQTFIFFIAGFEGLSTTMMF